MNRLNKKGEVASLGMIVMLFVGIIVALALFAPIADTTALMTTKQVTENQSVSTVLAFESDELVNETINFSIFTQSNWKTIECPLTSVAIRNGVGTALVADTDYTLDANNGRYSLLNTSLTIPSVALNLTYADFTYCADGYNTSGGSRSMANLTVIFSALIIFAFVLLGIRGEWFK